MNDNEARRTHFEKRLAGMDVFLDQIREGNPGDLTLDYRLDPLPLLEVWLLARYPDLPASRAEMSGMVNAAGVYVGEIIRKPSGGKWRRDENEKSAFFATPVFADIPGKSAASPIFLVTAATDRRKGDYLRKVVG